MCLNKGLMMQNNKLQKYMEAGIFSWDESTGMNPITANSFKEFKQMAMDVDPFNPTSNGVPSQFTTLYVNDVVEQVLPKYGFTEIANPAQQGTWTTEQIRFRVVAYSGSIQPYTDFSNTGKAGINYTWVPRDVYRFQTNIQYGDLETAVMDSAKLDLVGDKRRSISTIIGASFNRFGFYGNITPAGVFLSKTYGLLNDPNLPAATPVANGASGSPLWVNKTAEEINNDVVSAMSTMFNQTGNKNKTTDNYVLGLDGSMAGYLQKVNQFGLTAEENLKKTYPNLRVVYAPEYQTILGFQLICENLQGQKAVEDLFTYKYRSHGVVRFASYFDEKVSAGSAGCGVKMPLCVVTKTGIQV